MEEPQQLIKMQPIMQLIRWFAQRCKRSGFI